MKSKSMLFLSITFMYFVVSLVIELLRANYTNAFTNAIFIILNGFLLKEETQSE